MHQARLPIVPPIRVLGLALGLAVAACQTTPTVHHATDRLPSGGLVERQPADVAVAEVRDEAGRFRGQVPVAALRDAFYHGLVDRLYSPVSLDYVDRSWTDASFGGGGAAEAVLDVEVTTWDTTNVSTRGIVRAVAEASLRDVRDLEGRPLWAVRVTRRIDLGGPNPEGDWATAAARIFAAEILAELPERDPVRANR